MLRLLSDVVIAFNFATSIFLSQTTVNSLATISDTDGGGQAINIHFPFLSVHAAFAIYDKGNLNGRAGFNPPSIEDIYAILVYSGTQLRLGSSGKRILAIGRQFLDRNL